MQVCTREHQSAKREGRTASRIPSLHARLVDTKIPLCMLPISTARCEESLTQQCNLFAAQAA